MNRIIVAAALALLAACDPPPDLRLYDAGPDADLSDAGTPGMGSDAPMCLLTSECAFTAVDMGPEVFWGSGVSVGAEECKGVYERNACGHKCYACVGGWTGPISANCRVAGYRGEPWSMCAPRCIDCL